MCLPQKARVPPFVDVDLFGLGIFGLGALETMILIKAGVDW